MSFQSLQYFSETGDLQGVADRLEEGEDPDEYDPEKGMVALSLAAVNGHVECVEALLEAAADTTMPDKKLKQLPIHWALAAPKTDENPDPGPRALAILKLLLQKNNELLEEKDPDGCTPLMIAAKCGQTDAAILLRELGAEVNRKSKDGKTPLHYSCTNGHIAVTLALMARGAYTHHTDNDGDHPLTIASRNRHMDLALAMTQRGAFAPCKSIDKALGRTSRVIKDKSKRPKKTNAAPKSRSRSRKKRGKSAGSGSDTDGTSGA